MGSDPSKDKYARDNEQPQHTLYLPEYYIAKTPVTNAQYWVFVEASDQESPEHWKDGKLPGVKGDHPVVTVRWHDAMAYCRWLAEVTGKAYRLPSEAEWEKAARGTDGRIWPWGNEWDPKRCNSAEGTPRRTTPVGQFSPRGDSAYGCVDMAGNVWEWTLNLWGEEPEDPDFKYPYDPEDGRENLVEAEGTRVTRGGAFNNAERYARCACRIPNGPDLQSHFVGFRVCVAAQ
jgi:formylglycine-generating enzyme required for sulfatase activity